MALIRCGECGNEVSDKAPACPRCGAPVDPETAIAAPERISFDNGEFIGTRAMLAELAKQAIAGLNYRLDAVDAQAGTATFTTGMTMGSWSGVSGTIGWTEAQPYRFHVTGQAKQNVKGGQAVALNLFDEANSKVRNVIGEMQRLAGGPREVQGSSGSCLMLLIAIPGAVIGIGHLVSQAI